MEDSKRYIRLGLFVVTSFVVLAVALYVLGWRRWFQPAFTFETYFNKSVAGLELGAPVNFRGVPLGQVTEILTSVASYERDTPIDRRRDYIVVRVKASMPGVEVEQMERDFATLIQRGLRAQTQLAGVTGQQFLELDFFDPREYAPLPFAWAPQYAYLPSAPSVAGEIIDKAQKFLASIDDADIARLARNVDSLVLHLDAKLGELPVAQLAASAQHTLQSAGSAARRLDAVLADPAIGQTLANTAEITARLRQLADEGKFDSAIDGIDAAAERLDALLGANQYDVRIVVQDLRVMADNLRVLSDTIKRDPAVVLFGQPPAKVKLPGGMP